MAKKLLLTWVNRATAICLTLNGSMSRIAPAENVIFGRKSTEHHSIMVSESE
jgi:hypothetical protein